MWISKSKRHFNAPHYTTVRLIDQAPSEVQWSSMCTETAFARAKAPEVLGRARHRVAVQSDGHAVGVARGVFRGISNLKVQPNLRQSGQISLSCLLFRCLPEDSSKSIFMPLRSCSKFLTTFLKSRSNLSIRIRLECLKHGLETPGTTFVIPITTWNRWSFETNKRNINI